MPGVTSVYSTWPAPASPCASTTDCSRVYTAYGRNGKKMYAGAMYVRWSAGCTTQSDVAQVGTIRSLSLYSSSTSGQRHAAIPMINSMVTVPLVSSMEQCQWSAVWSSTIGQQRGVVPMVSSMEQYQWSAAWSSTSGQQRRAVPIISSM